MKKKTTRKLAQKTKATRDSAAKRIAAAEMKDTRDALQFALYGSEADAVNARFFNQARRHPLDKADNLPRFIQSWLMVGEMLQEKTDRETALWKRGQLQKEMPAYFSNALETGNWNFFKNFADELKAEVSCRDAAMLKKRSLIRAELLAAKLSGDKPDISKMADEMVETEFPLQKAPKEKTNLKNWQGRKNERRKNIYHSLKRIAETIPVRTISAGRGRPCSK